MTPVQQEIRDEEMRIARAEEAALAQCHTPDERAACRRAYSGLIREAQDVIGQKHGLAPMLRYRAT